MVASSKIRHSCLSTSDDHDSLATARGFSYNFIENDLITFFLTSHGEAKKKNIKSIFFRVW